MKKVLSFILALFFIVSITGCAQDLVVDGRRYKSKGFFTTVEKNPCLRYRVIMGNVLWGVALFEMALVPTVYFFGFSLWEPYAVKSTCTHRDLLKY